MCKDARERNKWKVRLVDWVDSLKDELSKPALKLINETVFGLLSSGSLHLSSIARTLCEQTRLHHTVKRLSRMLGTHSEVTWAAEELLLKQIAPRITGDMVVAIDPGDLNRDGAPKSEHIGRVRDGDKGTIVSGYPLMHVVARNITTGESLPLLTRLLSSNRPGHRSENNDIKNAMTTVMRHLRCDPLWVIDRGGDRLVLWNTWIADDYRVLVRAASQRYWLWRDEAKTAQQIAKVLPLKHGGRLTRNSKETVRFGITRVYLKEHAERPLTLIVVRHGKQEPLVLVTTERARGRRQGERLIQSYMDRWACEEGYRFSKQGFDLEKVQARKFTTLQNLVALASLAWGLMAYYQKDAQQLIKVSRRQKENKPLQFPFYSILMGWQRLFQQAKTVFYTWWRKPKPAKDPPIPDLFDNYGGLMACAN